MNSDKVNSVGTPFVCKSMMKHLSEIDNLVPAAEEADQTRGSTCNSASNVSESKDDAKSDNINTAYHPVLILVIVPTPENMKNFRDAHIMIQARKPESGTYNEAFPAIGELEDYLKQGIEFEYYYRKLISWRNW
jgi:hypothetical protein